MTDRRKHSNARGDQPTAERAGGVMKMREELLMAAVTKFRQKNKESHEPTNWYKRLEGVPVECRFTPLDDRKRPVDPATGSLKTNWQLIGYQAHELDAFNGHVKGVGLMVGAMSGGIAVPCQSG